MVGGWRRRLLLVAALATLPGCAVLYQQLTLAYSQLMTTFSSDGVRVEMSTAFISRLENRVTMKVDFVVGDAAREPNPGFADGDLHFAGRSPQVRLPVVGEIINAESERKAAALVHSAEGTGRALDVTGVWRIWPEHAGNTDEEQGGEDETPHSTNPDHVFELHPVTRIEGVRLLGGFHPVDGFLPGKGATVVPLYEKVGCKLEVTRKTVILEAEKGLYNDLAVVMQLSDDRQLVVRDGRFVRALLLDEDGNLLARDRRMVFVKGTAPERAVRRLKAGDRLHVYGIPRVDLSEIARRVRAARHDPSALTGTLPYEVVVIGVYSE